MKRFLCLVLCFAILVGFAGCGEEVKEREFTIDYAKHDFAYSVVCGTLTPRDYSNAIAWYLPVTIYAYPNDPYYRDEKITYYDCAIWVSVTQVVGFLEYVENEWVCADEEVYIPLSTDGHGVGSAILIYIGSSPRIKDDFKAAPVSAKGTQLVEDR